MTMLNSETGTGKIAYSPTGTGTVAKGSEVIIERQIIFYIGPTGKANRMDTDGHGDCG